VLKALNNRDYRLLWIGQSVSHLGDQFHLIALPWLVLALTGDPLQLGLLLAAAGLPRAVLMLVGGAIADRVSPRILMLVSDLVRLVIIGLLVVAIAAGTVQMWMIYVLAISFGIVGGFFLPAAEASLPRLLHSDQLSAGNSLMMIANQAAQFVGPALAGTVIALAGNAVAGTDSTMTGITIAFGVDALTFGIGALSLWLMSPLPGFGSEHHPLKDVAIGLHYVWGHPTIRVLVIVIALANFLVTGPLVVGLPVLATQLPEGAAAFGLILSGYALGNLIGMGVAGAKPPTARVMSWLGVAIFPILGVVYVTLAVANSTWVAAGFMVVGGVANGYLAIAIITLMQQITPKHLIGRVMSLLMLSMFGLGPLSQVISGAVLQYSLQGLFFGSALGLMIPAVLAWRHRSIWSFASTEPANPDGLAAESDEQAAVVLHAGQPGS